nr:hypothetical protein [Bacillus wiedmannii]
MVDKRTHIELLPLSLLNEVKVGVVQWILIAFEGIGEISSFLHK